MRVFRVIAHVLLTVTLASEVFVLAGGVVNRERAQRLAIHVGTPLQAPDGYGLDFSSGPRRIADGCVVYRFVGNRCGYCQQETPGWNRLEPEIARAGCNMVLILPGLNSAPYEELKAGAPEIIWLPLDWAASVRFRVTPSTVIAVQGRIAWAHQGSMAPQDWSTLRALLTQRKRDGR